jgi:tetratricopeptide (TPR) repeat protein
MRPGGNRLRITLRVLLVLVVGVTGYWVGLRCWGLYHYRAAEEALRRRDFPEASGHLQKCLTAAPGDLGYRLLAGRTARRQGAYAEARRQFAVYRARGGSAEVLALEDKLQDVQQGNLEAVDDLLASCDDHPEAPDTPLVLEAVIEGSERALRLAEEAHAPAPPPQYLATARRAVDLWLKVCPGPADQVQGLYWRAYLFLITEDWQNGVADLRRALAIDPDHFEVRFQLAATLSRWDPPEAAEHLELLQKRHPDEARVRFPLALVRRSLGQLDEAKALADEVLAAEPDNASALLLRGQIALDMQRPGEAEPWLRRSYALEPDEPETNFALSRYYKMVGRAAEAKTYEEKFLRIKARRSLGGKPLTAPNRPPAGG